MPPRPVAPRLPACLPAAHTHTDTHALPVLRRYEPTESCKTDKVTGKTVCSPKIKPIGNIPKGAPRSAGGGLAALPDHPTAPDPPPARRPLVRPLAGLPDFTAGWWFPLFNVSKQMVLAVIICM